MNLVKLILSFVGVSVLLTLAQAQISVVDSGATGNQVNLGMAYNQSFDSLAYTNTAPVPWVNNSTLPGWYAYRQRTGSVTMYNAATETSPFGSFGILGDTDRALGSSLNAVQGDVLYFGAQFVNNSSLSISGVDIVFDGEQWFQGANFSEGTDSLVFSYRIFEAGQGSLSTSTGWTVVDALAFVSPVHTGNGNVGLNGNLAANRIAGIYSSITEFTLAPNQELWVRWAATDLPLTDHALAIDNLSVTFHAVPEPAAYAVMAGGLVLLVAWRRRRR